MQEIQTGLVSAYPVLKKTMHIGANAGKSIILAAYDGKTTNFAADARSAQGSVVFDRFLLRVASG
jgi:hypothetical protein